jgi:type IV secretion system protein VirB1
MPVTFIDLAQSCAPAIQIETLAGVVSLESGFAPLAIRIDSGVPTRDPPSSKAEAIEIATTLIAQRQDVDLGLGGINASDLGRLGLTIADAFDPCLNLKATARLLDGYYKVAINAGVHPNRAAATMLHAYYGRGDASLGEMASYDKQVREEARRLGPQLASLTIASTSIPANRDASGRPAPEQSVASSPAARREAKPASWDVFAPGRRSPALVFQNNPSE